MDFITLLVKSLTFSNSFWDFLEYQDIGNLLSSNKRINNLLIYLYLVSRRFNQYTANIFIKLEKEYKKKWKYRYQEVLKEVFISSFYKKENDFNIFKSQLHFLPCNICSLNRMPETFNVNTSAKYLLSLWDADGKHMHSTLVKDDFFPNDTVMWGNEITFIDAPFPEQAELLQIYGQVVPILGSDMNRKYYHEKRYAHFTIIGFTNWSTKLIFCKRYNDSVVRSDDTHDIKQFGGWYPDPIRQLCLPRSGPISLLVYQNITQGRIRIVLQLDIHTNKVCTRKYHWIIRMYIHGKDILEKEWS